SSRPNSSCRSWNTIPLASCVNSRPCNTLNTSELLRSSSVTNSKLAIKPAGTAHASRRTAWKKGRALPGCCSRTSSTSRGSSKGMGTLARVASTASRLARMILRLCCSANWRIRRQLSCPGGCSDICHHLAISDLLQHCQQLQVFGTGYLDVIAATRHQARRQTPPLHGRSFISNGDALRQRTLQGIGQCLQPKHLRRQCVPDTFT